MTKPHRKQISEGVGEKAPLLDRLIFWKRDLPQITGVSTRTIDRWLSTGEFPKPDVTISGKPVWRRDTIQNWAKPNA